MPVTPEDALVLDVLQGGRCFYCDGPVGGKATFDHLIPRAYGGADIASNVVLAHRRCNQRKGDRLPDLAELELLLRQRRGGRIGVWPPLLALKNALELGADEDSLWLVVAQAVASATGNIRNNP